MGSMGMMNAMRPNMMGGMRPPSIGFQQPPLLNQGGRPPMLAAKSGGIPRPHLQQPPLGSASQPANLPVQNTPSNPTVPDGGDTSASPESARKKTKLGASGAVVGNNPEGSPAGGNFDYKAEQVASEFANGNNFAVLVAEPGSEMDGEVAGISGKYMQHEFKAGRAKANELHLNTK